MNKYIKKLRQIDCWSNYTISHKVEDILLEALDHRTQKIIEDLEYYWNEKWIKTESKEIQSQYKGYKIAINVIKQKYENKN